MSNSSGVGVREFSWRSVGRSWARDSMDFAAANVHNVSYTGLSEAAQWDFGIVRTYSTEGFTLLHAEAHGPRCLGRAAVEIRDSRAIDVDPRDHYCMFVQLSGSRKISQFGRSRLVTPGSSGFFSSSYPYVIETDSLSNSNELLALCIPGNYVDRRLLDGRRFCAQEGYRKLDRLATETFKLFGSEVWHYDPREFLLSARTIAELIMLSLELPSEDSRSIDQIRSAHLTRIKGIIRKRLTDFELRLQDIAEEAQLSVGYVHKLFKYENISITEYIKRERLMLARDMLRVASSSKVTVLDISIDCGFSDSAHFSRCFKKAFGVAPIAMLREC